MLGKAAAFPESGVRYEIGDMVMCHLPNTLRNWVHENRLFSFHTLTYLKMPISIKSRRKAHKLPFWPYRAAIIAQSHKTGSNLAGVRNMEPAERCTLP